MRGEFSHTSGGDPSRAGAGSRPIREYSTLEAWFNDKSAIDANAAIASRAFRETGFRSVFGRRRAAVAHTRAHRHCDHDQARQRRAGVLPAAPVWIQSEAVSDHQISHDAN